MFTSNIKALSGTVQYFDRLKMCLCQKERLDYRWGIKIKNFSI